MDNAIVHTSSAQETKAFARQIASHVQGGAVFALAGDLGSGKTTFAQSFIRALHARRRVTSPTFILLRAYQAQKNARGIRTIVHVDAYRVHHPHELVALGLREYMARRDTVVVIEWANRVRRMIPKNAVWIRFEYGQKLSDRIISSSRGV